MLNVVALMGRLVADPQLRQTTTGKNVASFRVAVDRGRKDANGQNQADFFDADCHRNAPDAVHNCAATRLRLEQDGQRHAMAYYHLTVSDFRRRFYKNYLD